MSYQGNKPATSFESPKKDRFTGISGTTCSLTHAVSSVSDIIVWVNSVKQDFTNYSVSGNTLTLGGTLVSADIVEVTYVGRTYGSIIPSDASVGLNQLSATGTKSSSTFLAGDNSFKTVSGTTINNNADNLLITGSGTANTLNAEAKLISDGSGIIIRNASVGTATAGKADMLVIEGNASGDTAGMSILTANDEFGVIHFGDDADVDVGKIEYYHGSNYMRFYTNGSEGMRLDSSQRLSFGADAVSTPRLHYPNNDPQFVTKVGSTSDRNHYTFGNTNGTVGAIRTNGSSTHYETSSDYRLKENEVAISDGITRLKSLKPYKFNFKTDADTTVDGFFAHEVTPVVPEAISGDKDAMAKVYYEEGDTIPENKKVGDFKEYSTTEIQPQAIDQSKLVPLLTSALQEAITKIETLEARVQTLENA